VLNAIRMQARLTGDYGRAVSAIEPLSGVSWNEAGEPVLSRPSVLRDAETALGDMLLKGAQPERGRKLLTTIVNQMTVDVRRHKRPELWYLRIHPVALGLLGDRDAALALLERSLDANVLYSQWWWFVEAEPAFDELRKDRRFASLRTRVMARIEEQHRALERLRGDGQVPVRPAR
jgi:hypothetical protein